MRWIAAAFVSALMLPARPSRAQQSPEQRHRQVIDFLKKTAADISARSLADIQNMADWKRERPVIRRKLLYMLGLDPLPKRTPLRAHITGTLQRSKYRIEKVVFQSSFGLYVTANLYTPNSPPGPLPAILYACGHSPHPLGAKWDYQDRAIWFAEHGYVCFILDTLEFGEVPGIHHGIHDLNMWSWLSLGYTPIGVEVWNAMRAIDYLETRPEVDKRRIGMTGISGGGSATWFTAAVDERIAAAASICSTYTFGSQAEHWVASGQCDCIYFNNTYLLDFPIVAALIAPRPLLICSGQKDSDFPPDGYHEVYRRAKRVFDLYDRPADGPERIKEVDADVGHTDAPLFLKEARQWMNRWLKDDKTELKIEPRGESGRLPPEELACLTALPPDAINYKIHEAFISTAPAKKWNSVGAWEDHRQQLLRELKESVFRWFPSIKAPFQTKIGRSDGGWAARYGDYKEALFDSEPGVQLRVQLITPKNRTAQTPLLIYVKRPGDSIYFLDLDELLPVLGRCSVLILNPRLTEQPVSAFEYAEIERSASWVGRTVAGMEVWDILRGVDWATSEERLTPESISLYGKGDMGILALYAGLFDSRVKEIILRDPPDSHRQGHAAILNVLRVTDIPEVAAAFAPRKLTFVGEVPHGFEESRDVFRLVGSSNHFTSVGSLPEALEIWKYKRESSKN